MALFLSESISHISNKEVSDIDMMTSLMEAQQEMAMFTESVLRADFILHEQCRTILMEADDKEAAEAKVDDKKGGFLSKIWEALKNLIKKIKDAVTTVYNWLVQKATDFWKWVKAKYSQVKEWFVGGSLESEEKALEAAKKLIEETEKKSSDLQAQKEDIAAKKAFFVSVNEKTKIVKEAYALTSSELEAKIKKAQEEVSDLKKKLDATQSEHDKALAKFNSSTDKAERAKLEAETGIMFSKLGAIGDALNKARIVARLLLEAKPKGASGKGFEGASNKAYDNVAPSSEKGVKINNA